MTKSDAPFAEDDATDVFRRIAARLPRDLPSGALDRTLAPPFGDHSLNSWAISAEFLGRARVAYSAVRPSFILARSTRVAVHSG